MYKTKPSAAEKKCDKKGGDGDTNYEWRKQSQACAVGCGKGISFSFSCSFSRYITNLDSFPSLVLDHALENA